MTHNDHFLALAYDNVFQIVPPSFPCKLLIGLSKDNRKRLKLIVRRLCGSTSPFSFTFFNYTRTIFKKLTKSKHQGHTITYRQLYSMGVSLTTTNESQNFSAAARYIETVRIHIFIYGYTHSKGIYIRRGRNSSKF